ncbi:MAG: hypothetical protein JRJ86_11825 [Deltaproteobacteria bacterium]|nr:hypothetical protein [Deltaproteobacteria bacterium]MBW2118566.1 hypothetical protein [Deltaproteobacteria bacterium]
MTDLEEIWEIILTHMPGDRAWSLKEIYRTIEGHANLDPEDFRPESPTSNTPKWKRNVLNILRYRTVTGEIYWDRDTIYLLAQRDV